MNNMIKNNTQYMKYIYSTLILLSFAWIGDAEEKNKNQVIQLSAKADPPGQMKFAQALIKAKAGGPIELIFKNPDLLQHNVLILKPGT